MGKFKGSDMKKQMYINQTLSKMRKSVLQLEKSRDEFLAKARQAKLRGDTASYKLAKSGLNVTIAQLHRAQEMLLNIEITNELKQMTDSNALFLQTIGKIAKSICKINRSSDFVKLQKSIHEALDNVEQSQQNLDGFLLNTDSAFENMSQSEYSLSDAEIEALVNDETEVVSTSEIDELLKKVNKVEVNNE